MNTMITPWEIYWVLQLDSIIAAAVLIAVVSGVVAAITSIVSLVLAADNPDGWYSEMLKSDVIRNNKRAPVLRKAAFRILVFLFLPSFVLATLLPSTSTAAAMIVAPKIINSPTVQHEAGDLYKLAKQALENAVAPSHNDKGGEK